MTVDREIAVADKTEGDVGVDARRHFPDVHFFSRERKCCNRKVCNHRQARPIPLIPLLLLSDTTSKALGEVFMLL